MTLGLDAVASSLIHTSPIIAYRVNLYVCRLLRPDVPTQEEVTQRSSYIPDPVGSDSLLAYMNSSIHPISLSMDGLVDCRLSRAPEMRQALILSCLETKC